MGAYISLGQKQQEGMGFANPPVTILDEGTEVLRYVQSLDFRGKGVTVTKGTNSDVIVSIDADIAFASSYFDPYLFAKKDPYSPAFIKTSANALSLKAGTVIRVADVILSFAADKPVALFGLVGGRDYAIFACFDGNVRSSSDFTAPPGYTTGNSRLIGGFHYGLVAPGTTPSSGEFNTLGSPTTGGMVWTQAHVDRIAGVNSYSLWDLKFRPRIASAAGMALTAGQTWLDIYLCSSNPALGTSRYNSNIASATVLPLIPPLFGGNGSLTYPALNWWVANEIAKAAGKRLPMAEEFYAAAFGVTEGQVIDAGSTTYPNTTRNPGHTSQYGIEQATGVHYILGGDSSGVASGWAGNGGRGDSFNYGIARVLLGGARGRTQGNGSRASNWGGSTDYSGWDVGLRAACDHMIIL